MILGLRNIPPNSRTILQILGHLVSIRPHLVMPCAGLTVHGQRQRQSQLTEQLYKTFKTFQKLKKFSEVTLEQKLVMLVTTKSSVSSYMNRVKLQTGGLNFDTAIDIYNDQCNRCSCGKITRLRVIPLISGRGLYTE